MKQIYAAIATLSWIDPITGLPEVDSGAPSSMITRSTITAKAGYRFSNLLEASIEVDTRAGEVSNAYFSPSSGLYRGPSYLGTDSEIVGNIGRKITRTQQSATFRQLVGCRTMAPEKIGRTVGAVAAGVSPLSVAWGLPGAIYTGYTLGRDTAEVFKIFPPIWTELELTINLNGLITYKLLRHSLFPSVSYYAIMQPPPEWANDYVLRSLTNAYALKAYYNAVPFLDIWYEKGWGPVAQDNIGLKGSAARAGNPWSMEQPTFLFASKLVAQPQGF